MNEELAFKCPDCEKTVKINDGDDIPTCCGKIMKQLPLEACLDTQTAEHARYSSKDEPCDDNRGN